MNYLKIIALTPFILFTHSIQAQTTANTHSLSLGEYLNQVKNSNQNLKASQLNEQSAESKKSEASLFYSPQAIGGAQGMWDQKKNISVPYSQMNLMSSNIGIAQTFKTGTSAKIGYQITQTEFQGIPSIGTFYEGKTSLEVSQPLLKNAWGNELNVQVNQAIAAADIKSTTEKLNQKLTLLEAEGLYLRLAVGIETLNISKDTLERTEKMHQWSSRRSHLSLADSSDSMQTQAALELRKLQLLSAQEEVRLASKLFNRARGIEEKEVSEKLTIPAPSTLPMIATPKSEQTQIAKLSLDIAQGNEKLAESKYSPSLDLFGSVALNSNDTAFSSALSKSAQFGNPTYAVGVKFQAPLDFGNIKDVETAAIRERLASETTYQKKQLDEKSDFNYLIGEHKNASEKMRLTEKIESLQKNKLENERNKLTKGRSTTAQVLTFEEDYAQSRLNRIRLQAAVLQIETQLKLYF